MAETVDSLKGYFSVAYSPDDEAECGRGYYAELCWSHKTSPLYLSPGGAIIWAKHNGGVKQLPNGDGRTY